MFHSRIQVWCAWSGMVAVSLFFIGFLIAGFLPPLAPSLSADEVAAIYQQNMTEIRIGMVLMMVSGMFVAPFVAVISVQIRRIEGSTPILSYVQLSAGTAGILFFVLPGFFFLVTAFRPDRSPEMTMLMNDISWLMPVIVWPPAFMQNIAIGIAVLSDRSASPVFPRWLAYFNFWIAILFVAGSLPPFFKTGPFAWNGIVTFWMPATVFGIWFAVMTVFLLRAIRDQARVA